MIFTSDPSLMKHCWLQHYFPRMVEDSIQQMPTLDSVKQGLAIAGFENFQIQEYCVRSDLADHFLYVGKDRPELYLDPTIRQGISSFTSLANAEEVKAGLVQLQSDLKSGKVSKVMDSYRSSSGDYLFIQAMSPAGR